MNVTGQTDNFQSYSYSDLGISLKKPSDWAFVSLKNGLQLIEEKNVVYLEIRKSNSQPSNTTLEQLANNAIQERFSSRKDFQLLNLSKTSISENLPAYKAVYEFLKTPNENPPTNEGTTNKVLRITTFANGVAYIIKYVSEKNKYDSYLPIAEKIIDSLKFNVQENVKTKSDNNNNNNNNNNKNHKTSSNNNNKLKECFSGKNGPPCILSDNTIGYNCNDDRHFKSPNEECVYWNKSTGGWDLRLTLGDNHKKNDYYNNGTQGKITVGYGDLGGYSGKGKIVIKNKDTGQTLVTHDINFAKLRASEGNDCCYKVYTFDDSNTHNGDTISAKVTGGGGSWESGPYDYKNNLKIGMTLDEIGEDVDGNPISNNNHKNKIDYNKDLICDSDKSTKVPSCDKLFKEQEKNNDNNNNDKEEMPDLGPPEEDFEVQGNLSG